MLKGPFLEKNFIGATTNYDEAEIVLIGMPYDCTCSNRPGTRFAPQQVRVESVGIETYSPYFDFDIANKPFFDAGDLEFPFGNAEKTLKIIEENTDCIYNDGKKILGIGGEHLLTLAEIKSIRKKYKDLAVIQFDAHTDLREEYLGEKLTHSGVMYRIAKIVGYDSIAQIGIRSGQKEEFDFMNKYHTLVKSPLELDKFKNRPVFLTIDVDVLDPSLMPGTGTPEAGGMTYIELINMLKCIKDFNIIGADIMELAPDIDPTKVSTATACKLIREVLSFL